MQTEALHYSGLRAFAVFGRRFSDLTLTEYRGNLFTTVFVLCAYIFSFFFIHIREFSAHSNFTFPDPLTAEGALRAGPDADPPLNMHRALIFHGAFILATASTIFLLRGKQARKELDELKQQQALGGASSNVGE
jgi:hypothetical protein